MDVDALLRRRGEILARHAALEAQPGSGWHRKDPSGPFLNDQMPLSARPVAFVGDDEAVLAGGCAALCCDALAAFLARHGAAPGGGDDQLRQAAAAVARQELGRDLLRVPRSRWNAILWALAQEGVLVCSTSLEG